MKITLTTLFSLFTALFLHGQAILFTTGADLRPEGLYHHFIQTSDSGFIHSVYAFDTTGPFVYLFKYDPIGNTQWTKRFPVSDYQGGSDYSSAIIETSDSGYMIATTFNHWDSISNTVKNYVSLVKTDGAGNLLWTSWYPGLGESTAYDVCETADHGFAVCGITRDTQNLPHQGFVFKTDSIGNQLWAYAYNEGTSYEDFYSIQETSSGDLVVLGTVYKYGAYVRLDSIGAVLVAEVSSSARRFVDGVETPSGNFVALGANPLLDNTCLYEITPAGAVTWSKRYNYGNDFTGASMTATPGGYTMISNNNGLMSNLRMAHVDFSGNTLWAKEYTDVNGALEPCLVYTPDHGYCFAGEFVSTTSANDNSIIVVKTDSTGTSECNVITLADSTSSPVALSAITYSLINVLVDINATTQIAPVFLNEVVHCLPTGVATPQDTVESIRVYPNPSDDQLFIEYSGGNMRIRVCDALGKTVLTEQGAGPLHVVDIAGLAPGMYFVLIEAVDGTIAQQRIIVH
jgi:hypothetical protein